MKSIKELNSKDKPGHYFMNMTNINDFDPNMMILDQLCLKSIIVKNKILHILFLMTQSVFFKKVEFTHI